MSNVKGQRKKPVYEGVVAWLKAHPEGATIPEISQALGYDRASVRYALSRARTRLGYIDRWKAVRTKRVGNITHYQWVAVWCLIDRPPDAPRPTHKPSATFSE